MKVRRIRKYFFRFSMDGIAEATYTWRCANGYHVTIGEVTFHSVALLCKRGGQSHSTGEENFNRACWFVLSCFRYTLGAIFQMRYVKLMTTGLRGEELLGCVYVREVRCEEIA